MECRPNQTACAEVIAARRMFRRIAANWASDWLRLTETGLNVPTRREGHAWASQPGTRVAESPNTDSRDAAQLLRWRFAA